MKTLVLMIALQLSAFGQLMPRRAPGFSLPEPLRGSKQHDLQDYRGKVVLIEFMKTGCPNCEEMTKLLEQVTKKYGAKVQVLSVVVPPDQLPDVARYAQMFKVTSPILFDCGQMLASYLQITPEKPQVHFPHLVVIDKTGMIRNDIDKPAIEVITSAVEPLLK